MKRLLKALDFNIEKNKVTALVGESGSGKTTTGMGILRLIPVTDGKVRFAEGDMANLSSNDGAIALGPGTLYVEQK